MATTHVEPKEDAAPTGQAQVINDLSIQVATVNGSGSQTANLVLLRAIFQMGIPVSGKNLFPSNIAGLPTWFTIRASKHGYIARRRDSEYMVAMNPETAEEDVLEPQAGRGLRLRRAPEPEASARRRDLLPGAVRPVGGARVPRRALAQARPQHDLRRRAGKAPGHRDGGNPPGAAEAIPQEGQGGGTELERRARRLRIRREEPGESGPSHPCSA